MWRGRWANRFTDYWLTLLQGHPTFVFWPAHVANHHRFRTYATWHAPTASAATTTICWATSAPCRRLGAVPLFLRWLGQLRQHWPGAFRYYMGQYLLWLGSWACYYRWIGKRPCCW